MNAPNYSARRGDSDAGEHLQVAVQVPLRQTFTYAPPPDCDSEQCPPGTRLWVPFGRMRRLGVVLEQSADGAEAPSGRIRAALKRLDAEPLLGERDLALARFTWTHYHLPPGLVLSWMLPSQLRLQKSAAAQVLPAAPDNAVPANGCSAELKSTPPPLTDEQAAALEALNAQPAGFAPTLLQGVTGSGKTEIYLRLMEQVLAAGGQVLYLVPEIGLTPQAETRVGERFSVSCASLHSRIGAARRLKTWNLARTGQLRVLIGTRSAVFTPMPSLALIVVDEEHDSSLRQDQGGHYSARDLALWRGRQCQIPVLLGSATPSLESLAQARSGHYHHLLLQHRVDGSDPPAIEIVDRRKVPQEKIFKPQTVQRIRQHLEDGRQALLFLNRRGWARVLLCNHCGWRGLCDHCDAPLVLHLRRNSLRCHHCNRRKAVPPACPQCGEALATVGPGTEKLERWCEREFPGVPVLRIDSDTTRPAGMLKKMLKRAETETPALLVGTRMLTKGHHLPHLGLAVVADASLGLLHPDFRTAELSAQTLVQVAGRAGREMRGGQVLLETSLPQHPLLRLLADGDYAAVADRLLEQRRAAALPPFSYLAVVTASSSRRNGALDALETLCQRIPARSGVTLVGPMPRALERLDNRWRAILQLRSARRSDLHRTLNRLAAEADALTEPGLSYSLAVDPLETL